VGNPFACECFDQYKYQASPNEVKFHAEKQDTSCEPWRRLLALIEEAAADRREEFAPLREMNWEGSKQIVTLPPTISKLKFIKKFSLEATYLVRIPPEIGEMTNLEIFETYMSHRLHWYPYEITRCKKLKSSMVSTRSLYGNINFRPPFPKLQPGRNLTTGLDLDNLSPEIWGTESITACSVCNRPLKASGLHQVWISLLVATDVLPLLVNACSEGCIQTLPKPTDDYVQEPHMGGLEVKQPPSFYGFEVQD
jgi:hypothetical protein